MVPSLSSYVTPILVSVLPVSILPTISCTCSVDNCVLVSVEAIVTAPASSVIVTFDPAVNARVSLAPKVLPPAVTGLTVSVFVSVQGTFTYIFSLSSSTG